MLAEHSRYIAANVLNEGKIVTYRSLARALKIHSNVAKRILYEYHHNQISKKPGSIHATYLVSGIQFRGRKLAVNVTQDRDGEDVHMQSSPFMSSSVQRQEAELEQSSLKVMTLVQEQHLEVVKSTYQSISSIHIYSLEPIAVQNLQVLSDVKRDISLKYAEEDPLVAGPQYGTIINPNVKRRTGPRPVVAALTPTPTPQASIRTAVGQSNASIVSPAANAAASTTVSQSQAKSDVKQGKLKEKSKKPTGKAPALKREPSDIFKSFGKPIAKLASHNTVSSADETSALTMPQSHTSVVLEDEAMNGSSEDEKEEDVRALAKEPSKDVACQRTSKSEREDVIRKMMDDEDEPMKETMTAKSSDDEDSPSNDQSAASEIEVPDEPPPSVTGSRKRGRRKVLKKKMLKDEEGYLVTKEEIAWESFSEDEPPPSTKPKILESSAAFSAQAKPKMAGGKVGQGNIMSFFGKK